MLLQLICIPYLSKQQLPFIIITIHRTNSFTRTNSGDLFYAYRLCAAVHCSNRIKTARLYCISCSLFRPMLKGADIYARTFRFCVKMFFRLHTLATCYSAAYVSQTRDQKRFTVSEVGTIGADWHELTVPQRIM